MPVNRVDRVEDKAWYLCVLDECKRIASQYPVGHTEEKKIRAQIKEIERRLASL